VYPERENEVLFCVLATESHTKKDENGALVHQLSPVSAQAVARASLGVRHRHLIVVPMPLPRRRDASAAGED
jgi:hypothetical protein